MHTQSSHSIANTSIRQSATMVDAVLILPLHAAAMTLPRSTAMRRSPDTANSRSSTAASAQAGKRPTDVNQHMAAVTSTLSASGSRNFPILDT